MLLDKMCDDLFSMKTEPTLLDAQIHGEYNEFYCFFECVGVPKWHAGVITDNRVRQSGDATVCYHPVMFFCVYKDRAME